MIRQEGGDAIERVAARNVRIVNLASTSSSAEVPTFGVRQPSASLATVTFAAAAAAAGAPHEHEPTCPLHKEAALHERREEHLPVTHLHPELRRSDPRQELRSNLPKHRAKPQSNQQLGRQEVVDGGVRVPHARGRGYAAAGEFREDEPKEAVWFHLTHPFRDEVMHPVGSHAWIAAAALHKKVCSNVVELSDLNVVEAGIQASHAARQRVSVEPLQHKVASRELGEPPEPHSVAAEQRERAGGERDDDPRQLVPS
mmetsp:Transcript_1147/g.4258  ORF Transcript_1147/g.4258 Transcript_1147/m.4258 type:complete len:256 (+) Transcript_1147:1203-1970(+)